MGEDHENGAPGIWEDAGDLDTHGQLEQEHEGRRHWIRKPPAMPTLARPQQRYLPNRKGGQRNLPGRTLPPQHGAHRLPELWPRDEGGSSYNNARDGGLAHGVRSARTSHARNRVTTLF